MAAYDFLYPVVLFGAILVATAITSKVLSFIIKGKFKTWAPVVRANFQRLVSITVWIIGLLFAVDQLGLRIDFFLLIMALLGIAILLALRDTLDNLGAKYFSDVYVPFKVGDIIKVANKSGTVIEINPIATVLLTDNESLVSIPNSLLLKEKMENITPHIWKEMLFPITISSDINLPEFESEILKACNNLRKYLDERFPPVLTIKSRSSQTVELVLTLMVKKPDKKNEIIKEINLKISEIEDRMRRKVT